MTKSEIFRVAHEVRMATGCSMSLALRQVYALRRCFGFAVGAAERVTDVGKWLLCMIGNGAAVLAAYEIPAV